MQEVQEKPQAKVQISDEQKTNEYRPSVWPAVLTTSAKVCYGLSAVSALATVGIWNRSRLSLSLGKKASKKLFKAQQKPSKQSARQTWRLSAIVGACAPTLAAAAKAFEYASTRATTAEYAQWEKQQAKKARSFARFFNR